MKITETLLKLKEMNSILKGFLKKNWIIMI